MAKNKAQEANPVRDAIEAFVKSPEESHYAPEDRKEATSKPYHELAGDRNLPVEIHRALATTEKKGALYNLLGETRFEWAELKDIYDRLGATEEATVRLLHNPVTPVEFILEAKNHPSPKVAEALYGAPKMPVSEFFLLVEEVNEVSDKMEALFPEGRPSVDRGLSPRWEQLRKRRFLLESSANKWCEKHEDPVSVIKAVDQVKTASSWTRLRRLRYTAAKREDVDWEMVKEHSPDWSAGVASAYIAHLTHEVSVEDRAAVVSGRIRTTAQARIQALNSSWDKFKPKKINRLVRLYNRMLEEQGEEDLLAGIRDSFLSFSKYWNGDLKFSSDDDTPVEKLFYEKVDPVTTSNLGFVSFPQFLKVIAEDVEKVARVKELKGKQDEESVKELTRLRSTLLYARDGRQRAETTLRTILATDEGAAAWEAWLRNSSPYPELADIPYEWALEVLI